MLRVHVCASHSHYTQNPISKWDAVVAAAFAAVV